MTGRKSGQSEIWNLSSIVARTWFGLAAPLMPESVRKLLVEATATKPTAAEP